MITATKITGNEVAAADTTHTMTMEAKPLTTEITPVTSTGECFAITTVDNECFTIGPTEEECFSLQEDRPSPVDPSTNGNLQIEGYTGDAKFYNIVINYNGDFVLIARVDGVGVEDVTIGEYLWTGGENSRPQWYRGFTMPYGNHYRMSSPFFEKEDDMMHWILVQNKVLNFITFEFTETLPINASGYDVNFYSTEVVVGSDLTDDPKEVYCDEKFAEDTRFGYNKFGEEISVPPQEIRKISYQTSGSGYLNYVSMAQLDGCVMLTRSASRIILYHEKTGINTFINRSMTAAGCTTDPRTTFIQGEYLYMRTDDNRSIKRFHIQDNIDKMMTYTEQYNTVEMDVDHIYEALEGEDIKYYGVYEETIFFIDTNDTPLIRVIRKGLLP